jgi:hypothetical protein
MAEFIKVFTEKHYPGLGFDYSFVSATKPL